MSNCDACGKELVPVFPDLYEAGSNQFDNALEILSFGGYGMFHDPTHFNGNDGDATVVICHDCAHQLVSDNPWLRKIIDDENGHGHVDVAAN